MDILRNVILNHANVSFDSDPDNLQKLIMFTVTNSDACAVSMDEKSQAVWRENPELLIELMRLQKFMEIHPKYSGFSRLGADEMSAEPEKVLILKPEVMEKLPDPGKQEYRVLVAQAMAMAQKDSLQDPDDYLAYQVYEQVRVRMFQILADKNITLTGSETALFQQAIANSLTGVGSGIVVGQYAVKVDSVKCSKAHDDQHATEPKYQPHITLRASREAKLAGQVLGEDKAIKNAKKLCEEYRGQADQVREAVNDVVQSSQDQEIRTAVAKLTITPVKESEKKAVESALEKASEAFLPVEVRSLQQEMNQLFKKAQKSNFAESDVRKLQSHISNLGNVVEESSKIGWQNEAALNNALNKFRAVLQSE